MSKTRKVTKTVVRTVASLTAGGCAVSVVKSARSEEDDNALDSAVTLVGGSIIGWMIGDLAADYAERKLDSIWGTEEN